jgi:hypothetical protein
MASGVSKAAKSGATKLAGMWSRRARLAAAAGNARTPLIALDDAARDDEHGTFKLPASSSVDTPFKSSHGDALPPIMDHEVEHVTGIAQQSKGVATTAVFESKLPHIQKLIPLQDLLCPSAEALGAKMAAASPEFSVYFAARSGRLQGATRAMFAC